MENVNSAGNVKIPTVSIAVSECHQGVTAVNGTAQTLAEPVLTTSGKQQRLTPTNTKRQSTVKRPCQQCGREMVVRRPSKRYCGAACRRAAWLVRNPEKAAALAISDKARLREHLAARGVAWVEITT